MLLSYYFRHVAELENKPPTKLKPVNTPKPDMNWNSSGKVRTKPYTPNLTDFFPRDYYTCMPTDAELLFLNKELKGQSLNRVKNLIKKDLSNNSTNSEQSDERVVVFKPKSVLDVEVKAPVDSCVGRGNKFTSLSYGDYYNSSGTLKEIKKQLCEADAQGGKCRDEKLKIVERVYGKDLSNYMMDKRHGKMSQKYEKVFIY